MGDEPVSMKARDVQSKIEITKDERVVESISEVCLASANQHRQIAKFNQPSAI